MLRARLLVADVARDLLDNCDVRIASLRRLAPRHEHIVVLVRDGGGENQLADLLEPLPVLDPLQERDDGLVKGNGSGGGNGFAMTQAFFSKNEPTGSRGGFIHEIKAKCQ